MITATVQHEPDYNSAQDLMNNNANEGAWQGKFRDKFEERSDQLDQIQAGLNEEAALTNISKAQKTESVQYIIDPISGELVETSDGYEDGLSVASVLSLIELGASDAEIATAIDEALTTIAGRIASDKKNERKYLAQLQELMHILELSLKQTGKNFELQNNLRQLQERMSKLMQAGETSKILEFLRSAQLREALTKSIQTSRQQTEFMRTTQEMMRNLASQIKQANLPREATLKTIQQATSELMQNQIRDMMRQLKEAFDRLSKQAKSEKDPTQLQAIKEMMREISRQAQEIQKLNKLQQQTASPSLKQFELIQREVARLQQQTQQLANNLRLNQGSQLAVQSLISQQQLTANQLSSNLTTFRNAKAGFEADTRSSVIPNLRAIETLALRNSAQQISTNSGYKPENIKNAEQPNKAEQKQDKQADKPLAQAEQQQRSEQKQQQLEQRQERSKEEKQKPEGTNLKNQKVEAAIKADVIKRSESMQRAEETVKSSTQSEKANPCSGCSGGKGCCASTSLKVEEKTIESKVAPTIQQISTQTTQAIDERHSSFQASIQAAQTTAATASVMANLGPPPAAVTASQVTAPAPSVAAEIAA